MKIRCWGILCSAVAEAAPDGSAPAGWETCPVGPSVLHYCPTCAKERAEVWAEFLRECAEEEAATP